MHACRHLSNRSDRSDQGAANHIHGIVRINVEEGDPPVVPTLVNRPRPRSLGSFIAGYKSCVTRYIARAQHGVGATGGSPIADTGKSV